MLSDDVEYFILLPHSYTLFRNCNVTFIEKSMSSLVFTMELYNLTIEKCYFQVRTNRNMVLAIDLCNGNYNSLFLNYFNAGYIFVNATQFTYAESHSLREKSQVGMSASFPIYNIFPHIIA